METRGKLSEHGSLEKKVSELSESERRLKQELEDLKADRDSKLFEYQKSIEKEKEIWKNKVMEAETKAKDAETRRSNLVFEFEKEKARWGLEKDHLISSKNDLQEALERNEKKKEQLLRENEKIRNEAKSNRKYLFGNSSNLSSSVAVNNRYMPTSSVSKSSTGSSQAIINSAISKFKENSSA